MSPEQTLARAIFDSAASLLAIVPADVARELRHLLTQPPPGAAVAITPAAVAAVRHHLPRMLATAFPAPLTPIGPALAGCWDRLDWHYHYPERPELAAGIAFAELVGPNAPLRAADIRVGFTFMAPAVFYPLHDHPAVELYIVLSGRAQWTRLAATTWQDPGAAILHASLEPHAMETAAEPLLALYLWSGEIAAPARYL